MKVKVIKVFRDKVTKERYKVGQVIDLPKGRAEDVSKRGLARLIETEKKEAKPNKSKKEKK